ncbi:hypothetical protein FPV67DRAFT_635513 [Lyophyllum atratum]|nr:hypothetical protein FPV67DRAFT_635513 [Lyophyllum atratum]
MPWGFCCLGGSVGSPGRSAGFCSRHLRHLLPRKSRFSSRPRRLWKTSGKGVRRGRLSGRCLILVIKGIPGGYSFRVCRNSRCTTCHYTTDVFLRGGTGSIQLGFATIDHLDSVVQCRTCGESSREHRVFCVLCRSFATMKRKRRDRPRRIPRIDPD